jgi:hypothetical protein
MCLIVAQRPEIAVGVDRNSPASLTDHRSREILNTREQKWILLINIFYVNNSIIGTFPSK